MQITTVSHVVIFKRIGAVKRWLSLVDFIGLKTLVQGGMAYFIIKIS